MSHLLYVLAPYLAGAVLLGVIGFKIATATHPDLVKAREFALASVNDTED